jgi:hypothetical protein
VGLLIFLALLPFALGWGLGDRWRAWIWLAIVWALVGWPLAVFGQLGVLHGRTKLAAAIYLGGFAVGFGVVEIGVRVRDRFEDRRSRLRAQQTRHRVKPGGRVGKTRPDRG